MYSKRETMWWWTLCAYVRAYVCVWGHACMLAYRRACVCARLRWRYAPTHARTQTQQKREEIAFSVIMIDLVNRTCKCESINFHGKNAMCLVSIFICACASACEQKMLLTKKQQELAHMRHIVNATFNLNTFIRWGQIHAQHVWSVVEGLSVYIVCDFYFALFIAYSICLQSERFITIYTMWYTQYYI